MSRRTGNKTDSPVLGGQLGEYAQVIAVAFGIGALVERSVAIFTFIKLAGAAYLIYLGINAVRHRRWLTATVTRLAGRAPGFHEPGVCPFVVAGLACRGQGACGRALIQAQAAAMSAAQGPGCGDFEVAAASAG